VPFFTSAPGFIGIYKEDFHQSAYSRYSLIYS